MKDFPDSVLRIKHVQGSETQQMVDGQAVDFALTWTALSEDLRSQVLAPLEPKTTNVTQLSFVGDDMAWISIASFFDNDETVSEELAALTLPI